VRVYVPPGNIHRSKFSLDVAGNGEGETSLIGTFNDEISVKVLDYYEDYFSIEYPLPKLDLILVPDFAYTAME